MLTISFDIFRIREGERVLDAGCGEGRHTFASSLRSCLVYAMDLDRISLLKTKYVTEEMYRRGEANGAPLIFQGDTLRTPFKDNSFDKIICAEVLEHVPDDRGVISELSRILKKGGEIAFTVPTPFTEKLYRMVSTRYFSTPGGHIRIYKPRKLIEMIRENQLGVYSIGFAHAFHSLYWLLRCLCGLDNDTHPIPSVYRRFLHQVALDNRLASMEKMCNYLFPKSLIIYAQKV